MLTSDMSEQSVNAVRRRFWIAWLASCAVLLLLGALVLAVFFYLHKGPLAASGGWYFFQRTEIPVPQFFQGDPRWANDPLGPTDGTLGAEGCAVASAAMVLKSYGIDTEPGALNKFLIDARGLHAGRLAVLGKGGGGRARPRSAMSTRTRPRTI